ncbi:MAG: ABC transporter permease [Cytophagales bacterium]|nr:ABC transporter permease [Cytophagales bacterium]
MLFIKLVLESFRFALNALTHNLTRTILSLTGVTIGIFAIIAALTVVDSLKANIKDSLSFLGTEVLYVEKWPYIFTPNAPWWEYQKRPMITFNEYKYLEANLKNASDICVFTVTGGRTIKRNSNSIGGIDLLGVTEGHTGLYDVDLERGRFFSNREIDYASNAAIIGHKIKNALFPHSDPIGNEIVIRGLKYTVIGLMKESGETLLNTPSNDESVLIPFGSFRKIFYTGKRRGAYTLIAVKGNENDVGLIELENEVRGLMRNFRGLRPKDKDDFAINRPEAITNQLQGVFDVLTTAGWFIGIFSILVGAFGIANIMFVTVSERTGIIGIQKSLGAKNYFILFQFLFEAIFLSLIGGGFGLLLVYLGTFIDLGSFVLTLMVKNIVLGIGISTFVGVASGIIPALMAARLDPVVAIRAN